MNQLASLFSGSISIAKACLVGMSMAIIEMRSHKLRSTLSVLGVLLGVASLTAMLTLVGGIDIFLNEKMGKWVGNVWFFPKGNPPKEELINWSKSPGLKFSDGTYLEQNVSSVKSFIRDLSRFGNTVLPSVTTTNSGMLIGMAQEVLDENLEHIYVRWGNMFSVSDYQQGNKVCLISWEYAEMIASELPLSDTASILNRYAYYNSVPLKIIGIYAPRDTTFEPWNLRRAIIIPLKTIQQYITGFDPLAEKIEIRVQNPKMINEQAEHIGAALTQLHRGVNDFEYRTADWVDEVKRMLNNVSMLMSIISLISLTVGGLSIMNVMLSSISERMREIGVRKALGARNLQIFVQFISETITLSIMGGSLGVLLGCIPLLFKEEIKKSTQGSIEPTLMLPYLIFTFSVIVIVGIIFGFYPALKATQLNTIDALRYE